METNEKMPTKSNLLPSGEDARKLFTKEHPHPTGAYWDTELQAWKGYKAMKGYAPPWNPYSGAHRKRKVTINEKKFLMVLSQTGNLIDAFKSVYKFQTYPDKRMENARCAALATQVLTRLKTKCPELVAAFTFDDITPDFIKKEFLKLYNHDHATIGEKTRLLELMGKTQAMFTDKILTDQKIREVVDPIYTETAEDFPDERADERIGRLEVNNLA